MEKEKRDYVFGIPFLPLAFFLLLIILLFVLPPFDVPITGEVTSGIQLTKTEYEPNENLEGEASITFFIGDLIPAISNVEFIVEGNNYESTKTIQLPQAIALSSTPWSGNFSYGSFNNMNGPYPEGWGYGFGACPQTVPQYPVTYAILGYAVQQPSPPQPITPDLTVTDIYTSGAVPIVPAEPVATGMATVTPVVPTERLYTKIKNLGASIEPGPSPSLIKFTVIACWYDYTSPTPTPLGASIPYIPGNCFYTKDLTQIAYNQEIILDLGIWQVEGKSVQVIVDYYDEILEAREDNNQMIKSFGAVQPQCIDSDGGLDYFTKGTCTDSGQLPYLKEDYCSPDAENLLIEYYCPPIAPSSLCQAAQYVCPNGCENGKCLEAGPSPNCKDSDGGKNYGIRGTCVDNYGDRTDYCLEGGGTNNLAEFYCSGNNLISWDFECDKCGEPLCMYIGTRSEGWYAKCPGGEKLINYDLCSVKGERSKPICLYKGTKSQGWYAQDVCEREEFNCYYGCLDSGCKMSNYSCDDWNNIYKISLKNLNIKAPSERGDYNFTVALTYDDGKDKLVLYSSTTEFEVVSHRACQNYQCVYVGGSGIDQCDSNSDCQSSGGGGGGGGGGGACNENWQYSVWSDCIEGKRERECFDSRNCGTTYAKPSTCLPRDDKFYQTESCVLGCQENWQCTEWSYCDQQTMEQSSICEDLNKCNLQNYTYIQLRDCCIEEWGYEWGPCVAGVQTLNYEDANNCGTGFTRPASETRACKVFPIWAYAVIIAVVVLIAFSILYVAKAWPFKKLKKSKTEEEAKFKEIKV